MRHLTAVVAVGVLLALSGGLKADPVAYTDEADFLAAVAALDCLSVVSESFEGSDWDTTRPDGIPGSLTTQGVTWDAGDKLKTGTGWARTGSYGVYDSWGDPDQLFIEIAGEGLVAVGGYFATFDGEFDLLYYMEDKRITAWFSLPLSTTELLFQFCGVIDPNGLGKVTIASGDGHWGADDFTIGIIPEPFSAAFLGAAFAGVVACRLRRRRRAET